MSPGVITQATLYDAMGFPHKQIQQWLPVEYHAPQKGPVL